MAATEREPAVTSSCDWNPKVRAGSESARVSACSYSIMPKECTAADCNEKPKKGSGISFHSFPKESHLLQQWLVKINRLDPKTKKLWKPNQHDCLCSRHFLPTDFTMRTQISRQENLPHKPMLRPDAVPTIFDHSQEVRKRTAVSSERRTAFIKRRRKEALSDILEPETADSPQAQEELFQEDPTSDEEQSDRHSVSVQTELLTLTTLKDKGNQTHSLHRQMVNVSQQTIDVSVPDIVAPQKLTTSTEACKTPAFSNAESQTDQIRHVVSNEDAEDEVTADLSDQEEQDNTDWGESTEYNKPHTLTEGLNHVDAFGETKYLVFESNLEELLSVCRRCSKICQVTRKGVEGTAVEYTCLCEHCSHNYTWCSQPYSKRLPLGNLVLAAAAFFTACSPSRLITLFKSCNICIFGKTTYNNLQSAYMVQAVRNVWTRCQERLFAARPRTRPMKLAGDGRCDSPGHCAKYGSYTFLDATTMEVLHIELIQSNMVKNSHAMELEGLKRGLNALKANVKISHLVTDRHVQIKSHMAKNEVEINHRFDIWHMAKGVGKKLDAASNKAGYSALGLWTKSIKNHLYYCAQSTPESPRRVEVVKAKWKSVVNHVSNQHTGHGETFPDCLHGDLSDEPRAWIRKDTPVHRCLVGIIQSPYLLRDIGQLSPDVQTAHLEAYHSVINHFAPKMLHFTFPVMQAKLFLAAMHTNANAGRSQATTEEGELQWKVARPKANKGEPIAKPVKENITRCYLNELFEEVVNLRLAQSSYSKARYTQRNYHATVPETLSATAGPVAKDQVVAKQRRRLNWQPTI